MGYATDLSDESWEWIEPFVQQGRMGRKRTHDTRQVLNGIFYVVKTGCQWRMIPQDFPPFPTLYYHFQQWSQNGTWDRILETLVLLARKSRKRKPSPSYGIIDSKSVPTASNAEKKGFDGGKKNQGKKATYCG